MNLAMVNLVMYQTQKDNQPPYLELFLCPKSVHIPRLLNYEEKNTFHEYLFGRQKILCMPYKLDHLKVRIEKLKASICEPSDENSEGNVKAYCQQVLNFLCFE